MLRTEQRTAPPVEGAGACIELHDVAPATWPECAVILAMLDQIGNIPVTLLVVPNFHGRGSIVDDRRFRGAIDGRLAGGDEVALHGYFHLDDGPSPDDFKDWVERRILTQAEGEFSAIDASTARERLTRGLQSMRSVGWKVRGFVPPAWLLSRAAREVLTEFPFDYTATRKGIYHLPGWRLDRTVTLAYSPRSAWRRAMSRTLIEAQFALADRRRVLRLALHPADARFPGVLERWRYTIARALETRRPVTKSASLRSAGLSPQC